MAGMTKSMESMKSWTLGMATSSLEYMKVKERWQVAVQFAKERPVAAILIGVAVATSFIPAAVFVSFVATFLVVGLITLLVIEGTAILSAFGILIFALCSSMVASLFIGTFLVSSLITARFGWRMSAPIRAKIAARLGMMYKDEVPVEKVAPEEQQMGFTSEQAYVTSD